MKVKLYLNHYVVGFSEPDTAVNEIEVDAHTIEIDGLKFAPELLASLGDTPDTAYKIKRVDNTLEVEVVDNGTNEDS